MHFQWVQYTNKIFFNRFDPKKKYKQEVEISLALRLLMLTIAVVGSGKLATQLVNRLVNLPIEVVGIWARNKKNGKELANTHELTFFESLNEIPSDTDLTLLAVSDSAVEEVQKQIHTRGIVAHCSGILPMSKLSGQPHPAVFWPVQTFSYHHMVNFSAIPIVIQANNEEDKRILEVFADLIGQKAIEADEQTRQKIHLAAVFVNNFTNYLFYKTDNFLNYSNIDFSILKPLIAETVNKLNYLSPKAAQTGPASRNDLESIDLHKKILATYPELSDIYILFTSAIVNDWNAPKE